jgi:hypothetical protein
MIGCRTFCRVGRRTERMQMSAEPSRTKCAYGLRSCQS